MKVHGTRQLDGPDIRVHERLPVTSPARTLLDSAGVVSRDELEQALDDALERHLVRLSEIKDVLARVGRGRKGAAVRRTERHGREAHPHSLLGGAAAAPTASRGSAPDTRVERRS
ncbi:MAG: hypothetical protein JO153_03685 [Solirubrobacterales bacterium]|nr:hypothetical protein [Solirubrobacterales bacterium]